MALSAAELARELEELVEALDRRLPRVEHAGEAEIVRDAATLRTKALARLAELTAASSAGGGGDGGKTDRES